MNHSELRTELSQVMRQTIKDKHVKGKSYKTVSKLQSPVTTVQYTVLSCYSHKTVATLNMNVRGNLMTNFITKFQEIRD